MRTRDADGSRRAQSLSTRGTSRVIARRGEQHHHVRGPRSGGRQHSSGALAVTLRCTAAALAAVGAVVAHISQAPVVAAELSPRKEAPVATNSYSNRKKPEAKAAGERDQRTTRQAHLALEHGDSEEIGIDTRSSTEPRARELNVQEPHVLLNALPCVVRRPNTGQRVFVSARHLALGNDHDPVDFRGL